MKILDVITSPWAIQPDKLLEIRGIYATHLRGEKISQDTIKAIEARTGQALVNDRQSYQVQDGVAIIDISGVLAKKMNLFSQISGGASSEVIGNDIRAALNDSAIHSIILNIDSPGGTVDGTQALAQTILAARDSKPIVALADGVMASAAYWIGSAAQAVYIADNTTAVGSIGVVAAHQDISVAQEKAGIKTTEIAAGKYKRIASSYAPLSADGKQSIQDQVDYLYSVFVSDISKNRGVSTDTVLKNMADGRMFIGQQAIDARLVDGVSTMDALVAELNRSRVQGVQGKSVIKPKGNMMTITRETLAAEAPELEATIKAEGHAEGLATGAKAELERIQSVRAQGIKGHEALIESLAFDGKTTGPEAAMQIVAAENGLKATALKNAESEAPAAVAFAAAADPKPEAVTDAKTQQAETQKLAEAAGKLVTQANSRGEKISYAAAVKQVMKEQENG
jgi:signal peptide peptidase SppA